MAHRLNRLVDVMANFAKIKSVSIPTLTRWSLMALISVSSAACQRASWQQNQGPSPLTPSSAEAEAQAEAQADVVADSAQRQSGQEQTESTAQSSGPSLPQAPAATGSTPRPTNTSRPQLGNPSSPQPANAPTPQPSDVWPTPRPTASSLNNATSDAARTPNLGTQTTSTEAISRATLPSPQTPPTTTQDLTSTQSKDASSARTAISTWPPEPSRDYIVVQNVATNTLRVYKPGPTAQSANEMIFETPMHLGELEPKKTRAAVLGNFRIERWRKFAQPADGSSDVWSRVATRAPEAGATAASRLTAPEVGPGAEPEDWLGISQSGRPGLIGLEGWYSADLVPRFSHSNQIDSFSQRLHGTIGWGKDWERFVIMPSSRWQKVHQTANLDRHRGSTRVSNPAIALLQTLLLPGTRIIRVYAAEKLSANYQPLPNGEGVQPFEYLLTSDQEEQTDPHSSLTPYQRLRAVQSEWIIEKGLYLADVRPDPRGLTTEVGVSRPRTVAFQGADIYGIGTKNLIGYFEVDTGKLIGYQHPKVLKKAPQLMPSTDPFLKNQRIPKELIPLAR